MKIGALSQQANVPVETIRYYEKIGLMPAPERGENGYRSYAKAHLDRLLFIRRCRNLDMAQEEIRELLRLAEKPTADCSEVDALLASHLSHVRARLKELTSLEQTLVSLQRACASPGAISDCGILDGLNTELDKLSDAEPHNHVPGTHGAGNGH
jgi:Cd(II)/Pb(II)-responsive transcriptional regulator